MVTTTLFILGILAAGVLGNIHFPKPYINCSKGVDQCYPGQICKADFLCDYASSNPIDRRLETAPQDGKLSPDGTCGSQNGGMLCDPNSIVYKGSCCSQYGWCGATNAYCGEGCQSGPCNGQVTSRADPSPTTSGEPIIGTSVTAKPTAQGKITKDGTCGANNGGTICTGWDKGECCSPYGFCGSTSAHCGIGCQSGPCKGAPGEPAPGPSPIPITNGGSFAVIGDSGVPVMHAALMQNGRVIFLDKIEDYTKLKLPNGQFAYSSEFDPDTGKRVPLSYKTNAFCSGGIFLADGTLVNIGGNGPLDWLDPTVGDGFRGLRYIKRSAEDNSLNGQSWTEPGPLLDTPRWYASVQTLEDGRIFVVSGSLNGLDPGVKANNNPTYEILSAAGEPTGGSIPMDILVENQPYYMYPFIHTLQDGSIFIQVSKAAQVFDIGSNSVQKRLPDLPGAFRTYPNTGGSVLLPLSSETDWKSDVVVCGGGNYQGAGSPTDPSCGRIKPEDPDPHWEMDSMPEGRTMVEAVNLPDGTVLWLNGANIGASGFELASAPTKAALLYDPVKPKGQRWTQLATSPFARLYHSVALLLLDGTVLVTGSNPHEMPNMDAQFPTEFRVERFTPPYLRGANAARRPQGLNISTKEMYVGQQFVISFKAPVNCQNVKVSMIYGGFVTHSVHMGQRMSFLDNTGFQAGATSQSITVTMPPNNNIATPGPHMIFVVVDGVPSKGQFIQVK